jgi:hypothetical protein
VPGAGKVVRGVGRGVQQRAHDVEVVNHQVEHHVGPQVALDGRAESAGVDGDDVEVVDDVGERPDRGVEPLDVPDPDGDARRSRARREVPADVEVIHERLLDEDVDAGVDAVGDDRRVGRGRDGDGDEVRLREQRRGVEGGGVVLVGGRDGRVGVGVGHPDEVDVRQFTIDAGVVPSHAPDADDAGAKRPLLGAAHPSSPGASAAPVGRSGRSNERTASTTASRSAVESPGWTGSDSTRSAARSATG